jgi:Mg2+-importing ATPase
LSVYSVIQRIFGSKRGVPIRGFVSSGLARRSTREGRLLEFASMPIEEVFRRLGATPSGLTNEEAEERIERFGPNELAKKKRVGFLKDIFHRIKSPLAIQLFVIASISAAIGETKSAAIVSVMLLLSIGLSYILDARSSRAAELLSEKVRSKVHVLRNGVEVEIDISNVVPGDVVVLSAGSIVPADIRLISARDFFVSESAFTGESMPVEKGVEVQGNNVTSPFELKNICFFGTFVVSGSARGVVVSTGMETLFGAISERLTARETKTDFDIGISRFTWLMISTMLAIVVSVFLIAGSTKGNWIEALIFAIAVAVGLTPEMLPMIITTSLARGALSMSKRKVIVKDLRAIQNLGAMDVLCTDKTGTLTQDRVVLERHVDVLGNVSEDVLTYAYLNSYFQTGLKSLIDRAILEHRELEVERDCRIVDELPFDFKRRRMSVIVDYEGEHVLICKGAVEEIYSCCKSYQIGDEVYPLVDMIKADLFEEVESLNRDGFRVLGIAYRPFSKDKTTFTVEDESELILLGYIAFFDPPKASASEAVTLLKKAGVAIKVLTGDNALVTLKVCKDVGIKAERVISGSELASLSDEELGRAVEENNVFVKLSPTQKDEIVGRLRRNGHVVGFLGDGINDAEALRAADVGVSVDTAADVAKESADIILLTKSLMVLADGILEGRKVFTNMIKYIRMASSSNFGNMFSMLGASYFLPFLPMQPIQILTNNLLYDISQTAIPTDNVDESLIERPLKWDIKGIRNFMILFGPVSSIFDYITFGAMWFLFGCMGYVSPSLGSAEKGFLMRLFQTGWFVESLLTQTLIVHIIRTRKIPFLESRPSLSLLFTTLGIMAFGIWLPYSPFGSVLGMVPLPATYWIFVALVLLAYSVLTHIVKTWFFKRYGGNSWTQ